MEEIPEVITLCNLEVVLMPQGEIICKGKSIGLFKEFKEHLTKKEEGGKNEKDTYNRKNTPFN